MEARAQLEQLLVNLLDAPPDASRNQRLDDLLRANPDLHGDYLDYLQLHALLQWRGGKVSPQAAPATEKAQPLSEPRAVGATRWRSGRGVTAALLVLAASVAAFFLWHTPEAQATPDVVERLIDWNLDLTQAQNPDERGRIYDEQAVKLKATLDQAELPDEDRQLAEKLLENSTLLAKNVDPEAEADRFDAIAAELVTRMNSATTAHDEKRMVQLAGAYTRLTEVGVSANLALARTAAGMDAERKLKLARATQRHANRVSQVADIIERNPESSRKAIHRAMKGHKKKY